MRQERREDPTALRLSIDKTQGLAYEPVHITVLGGAPGSTVTVRATAVDDRGVHWSSQADFRADAAGTVDLAAQAPVRGSYGGVDAMGLFWSMDPPAGDPSEKFPTTGFSVDVTATDQGATTTQSVKRVFQAPGETVQELTVAHDGFEGHLFLPPGLVKPTPALIMIGGSEGGESTYGAAMLMAAKGIPALSVGYFAVTGTPQNLQSIPLEYFVKAATWLEQQPLIDKRHVLLFGVSRGSEAALLTAQYYPDLVHGAVLIAPSAEVWGGLPDSDVAWTRAGDPVAPPGADIPVDKVDGPVQAFAGTDDKLWTAPAWARQIDDELNRAGVAHPHAAHVYQDAGHMVGAIPYLPLLTTYTLSGRTFQLGGTRQANAAAQAQTWKAVFDLMAGLSGQSG
ncbi:acyl-CoA thioesterase/BAAT N-terminal domain-containing protein [Catenulispora yoronensis]